MDESGADLPRLQGTWRQVDWEADGIARPEDELSAGIFTVIEGTKFFVRTATGDLLLAGSFVLDASTRPKSITWTDSMGPDEGKELPAIYTLDVDRFVFIAAYEGAPRPTSFVTTAGQTMRSFVRVNAT